MKKQHTAKNVLANKKPAGSRLLVVGWVALLSLAVLVVNQSRTGQTTIGKTPQKIRRLLQTPTISPLDSSRDSLALSQRYTDDVTTRADVIPITGTEESGLETTSYIVEQPVARVLIVRGILTVFSLGLDQLGRKLQQLGYDVRVTPAIRSRLEAGKLRDSIVRENDSTPLVIIGHSLGGDLAPGLAEIFLAKNVPVDLLVMLDSTMPSAPPQNVRRCINLYQSNASPDWARVFRGVKIHAQSPETELFNVDIRQLAGREKTAGIHHFNIDTNPWVQDLIVTAVKSGLNADSLNQLTTELNFERALPYQAATERGVFGVKMNISDIATPQMNEAVRRYQSNNRR